jgi:hypothetical protein
MGHSLDDCPALLFSRPDPVLSQPRDEYRIPVRNSKLSAYSDHLVTRSYITTPIWKMKMIMSRTFESLPVETFGLSSHPGL